MPRLPHLLPSQLALRLTPEPEHPPLPSAIGPTLVQALAELLLSALGRPTIGGEIEARMEEDGDEPEDHL
jgi:hypothetical protein